MAVRWVYVHDLSGTHRDDYLYSTDPSRTPQQIIEEYTGRWNNPFSEGGIQGNNQQIIEEYTGRSNIENLFQNVTEVFHLEHLIGATPRATIFEAAFCLLVANLITVVRAWVAAPQGLEPERVSIENLFEDVHRQLIAWYEVLTPEQTLTLERAPRTAAGLRAQLQQWLGDVWSERWRKPPRRKRTPCRRRGRKYIKGGHTSVFRILMETRNKRKRAHSASLTGC